MIRDGDSLAELFKSIQAKTQALCIYHRDLNQCNEDKKGSAPHCPSSQFRKTWSKISLLVYLGTWGTQAENLKGSSKSPTENQSQGLW